MAFAISCFNPHQVCKALKEPLGFLLRGFQEATGLGQVYTTPQACPPFLSEGRLTAPPAGAGHGSEQSFHAFLWPLSPGNACCASLGHTCPNRAGDEASRQLTNMIRPRRAFQQGWAGLGRDEQDTQAVCRFPGDGLTRRNTGCLFPLPSPVRFLCCLLNASKRKALCLLW